MGRQPFRHNREQDELAQKILLVIAPVYVRAHADHMASIFRDIEQVKARTKEEAAAAEMKMKSQEKSLRGIGAGVVKMARYLAMEFQASSFSELETALRQSEQPETTEIDLGNNARL